MLKKHANLLIKLDRIKEIEVILIKFENKTFFDKSQFKE
jgi:hypothetical protein